MHTDSTVLINTYNFSDLEYSKIAILVDENTLRYCYPHIQELLPKHILIEIPSGEKNKNLTTCASIWGKLTKENFDRNSLLINLGGGVIGDMGGFCAATFKRGIDFIQMPTTLLAQVDASVGGKLGIDFMGFKNQVGVFQFPKKVIIDTVFLQTLPHRELVAGFAEVVKHCLIADAIKWNELKEGSLSTYHWENIIIHSINIKQHITQQDPQEKGLRKILNFGHTVGHAIESYYLDNFPQKAFLHGEAVAIGMVVECFLSFEKDMLSYSALDEISRFIISTFGKKEIHALDEITRYAYQDKKNKGNSIRMSLLKEIGNCVYDVEVEAESIIKALKYYQHI